MIKPFENITPKNKTKLIKLLEAHIYGFEQKLSILKTFSNDNIIGIIIKGKVEIIKNEYDGDKIKIKSLKEDDIITSSMLIINNDDYEIITKEKTDILIIDYDILKKINPEKKYFNIFMKNMFIIENELLMQSNERLQILEQKSIRNKLLKFFEIKAKKEGRNVFYIKTTYTNLAYYLAADRSAMTRELTYLKEEGFIETNGKKVKLLY